MFNRIRLDLMIKRYFILSFAILIFYSCALNSSFSDNEDESTLSNGQEDSSLNMLESILEDKTFIIDSYPIPGKVKISKEESKTQRPKQLFSAAAKNEIRLHKLGEVRWVYMGIEPSSIWPRVIGYIETNNNLELAKADASLGIISSESFKFNGQDTKIEFKIEPGLQQSSSEIFVSHLVNRNGSWEIIPNINSNLEVVVNELYDYLSSSSPTSGTSLLALNLNTSNKTEVLVNDSGLKEIKLKVNFARAWASTRRSLLLAGFNIIDEDRNSGKFYLEYNFRRSVFSRTPSLSKVEILVSEKNKDECIISTDLGIENLDISEEIISQINQALS